MIYGTERQVIACVYYRAEAMQKSREYQETHDHATSHISSKKSERTRTNKFKQRSSPKRPRLGKSIKTKLNEVVDALRHNIMKNKCNNLEIHLLQNCVHTARIVTMLLRDPSNPLDTTRVQNVLIKTPMPAFALSWDIYHCDGPKCR